MPDAREIECAVLGNDDPQTSVPGEVIPSREFYDYEAKYLDEGSKTVIPADLPPRVADEIQRLSVAAFQAIDCAGMARVDFLLSRAPARVVRQRGQHDPRLHDDQHVLEDVGSVRRQLPGAPRPARRAGARTARRETAAAHQPPMIRAGLAGGLIRSRLLAAAPALADAGPPRRPPRPPAASVRRPRRRRAGPRLQPHPRRPLRRTRRRAPPRVRAGADRGVPRARGHGALVAHPARPRQPRARRGVLDLGRTRDRDDRGVDRPRARRCRGVVLSWRRLRRARAVAGAARRAARRGARRQAHQGGARTGARRSIPGSTTPTSASACIATTPTSRRRRPGFCVFCCCCPAAIATKGWRRCCGRGTSGRLLQGEADYQLHIVYLWYEHQTGRALELLRDLQQAHPGNPLFLTQIAEIQDVYQHDVMASLDSWRALLAQARADRVYAAGVAEVRARLGIARHLDALGADRRSHRAPRAASSPSSPMRRTRRSRWRICGSGRPTIA